MKKSEISIFLISIICIGLIILGGYKITRKPNPLNLIQNELNINIPSPNKTEIILETTPLEIDFFTKYYFDKNIDCGIFKEALNDHYWVDIKIFLKKMYDYSEEDDQKKLIENIDFEYDKDEIYYKLIKTSYDETLIVFNPKSYILYYFYR